MVLKWDSFFSGFRRKGRFKNGSRLVAKRGVMVPGVPSVENGNWGRECDSLIALRERRNIQNAVFCEVSVGKNHALYVHLTHTCWSFSERDGPRIILLESLLNRQSSCLFLRENKWAMYEFQLRKHWQKSDYCTDQMMLRPTPQKLKKSSRRKQNFQAEANNMQLDKEDIRRSNLNGKYLSTTLVLKYPDSFIYLFFLLCSISFILVKYDLILRYEARVNALKVSCYKSNEAFPICCVCSFSYFRFLYPTTVFRRQRQEGRVAVLVWSHMRQTNKRITSLRELLHFWNRMICALLLNFFKSFLTDLKGWFLSRTLVKMKQALKWIILLLIWSKMFRT